MLHHAVGTMIAARRRHVAVRLTIAPQDILMLLMDAQDPETGHGLSDLEIRANVIALMAAGHESTANAITWTLFLPSRSTEWHDRVLAEASQQLDGPAETVSDRLIETRAVIDEALRLYPPLAAISRVALADDELAERPIKRGAIIVFAPYVLHRHHALWRQADHFDPSRFLPKARKDIDRYAYLPFGTGPRGCIGSVFAMQEASLAVAAIIRSFELEMKPEHVVWPVHRITLRPRGGLPMSIHERPLGRRSLAS